jgi:transposase-like protein
MIAACAHGKHKKYGKDRKGNQRFLCKDCGITFIEPVLKPLGNMRIPLVKAELALSLLLEGMSIRAVERVTKLHRDTLCDLVLTVGRNCQLLLDEKLTGVEVKDVQIDELWSFVGCKSKTADLRGYGPDMGDSWTFIALERTTKLVIAHQVGERDSTTCCTLLQKLADFTVVVFSFPQTAWQPID